MVFYALSTAGMSTTTTGQELKFDHTTRRRRRTEEGELNVVA